MEEIWDTGKSPIQSSCGTSSNTSCSSYSTERSDHMPRKPKTPCRYPGCPELCEGRYCDQHQPLIDHDYNTRHRDREASRFYSSDRWRKLRAAKLSRTPLCEECARQGKTTAATMVDHIQPIKQGGRALDMDNLQSLCWSCHSAKSVKEGSRFGKR